MTGALIFELGTLALVGAGMLLLVLSAGRTGDILQIGRRTPFARTWTILRGLMIGFAVSYIAFIVLVLVDAHQVLAAMTGVILGAGGLFVFLVTRSSHVTLTALAGETMARRHVTDIVDHLSDGLVILDRAGIILSVNRRMAELAGAPAEALIGTAAAALVVPPEIAGHGLGRLREGTLRRRGGPPTPVEVQYVEILGEDGETRSGLLVVRDRRELVRRELQLESAVKATEAALRARHELGAVLSAEVRPRLEALRTVLGGLSRGDGPLQADALAAAQEALSGAEANLAGVLDAEGSRGVVARIVEVEPLLRGVSGALGRAAPSVSFDLSVGTDVPKQCRGRESTIREILIGVGNYLLGVGDPARIRISVERVPGDVERLVFRVACERADDRPSTPPIAGHGLGLAAARLLVQTVGGVLRVSGDEGRTTEVTFTAFLPDFDAAEPGNTTPSEMSPLMLVAAMAARSNPGVSMVSDAESRGSALVVDDSPPARELLVRLVRELGYEVESVSTGQACIERAKARAFDLVLLDLILPDVNGIDVITALREDERAARTSIVVVSAVEEIRSVAACLERGADDFLHKPVNPIILRARLQGIHENRLLSRQASRQVARLEEEIRRADGLLHAILPRAVADELQTTGAVVPRRYADVVVVFADIVGFTAYCEGRSPEEVLVHLQSLVREFEHLCRRHGVLKVKTVGDALIACGGLQDSPTDAVERCLAVAFALQRAADTHPAGWRLRVGVHRGPVVAGIVGSQQFSYDLWGDTVNTAQRIESHGVVGEVCISEAVRAVLPPIYETRAVEVREVKGKGRLEIYVVRPPEVESGDRGAAA